MFFFNRNTSIDEEKNFIEFNCLNKEKNHNKNITIPFKNI